MELLRYVREVISPPLPWRVQVISNAARNGDVNMMRYLREGPGERCRESDNISTKWEACPWDLTTTVQAARSGSMECLTYAVENGCPLHRSIYEYIVRRDDADMFLYVRDQSIELPEGIDEIAVDRRAVKCLELIYDTGLTPTEWTVKIALRSGDEECMKVILSRIHFEDLDQRKWMSVPRTEKNIKAFAMLERAMC
jgi:hypothetical protein